MTSRCTSRCLGATLLLAFAWRAHAAKPPAAVTYAQTPLAPSAIPQFVQPLPLLGGPSTGLTAVVADEGQLTLKMCEFDTAILPPGSLGKGTTAPLTRVWGYAVGAGACPTTKASYIGPVIVATRGTPTEIKFVNELGTTATTGVLAWKTSTDQTLHWADPLHDGANACMEQTMTLGMGSLPEADCAKNYAGPIPAVPHLHGGEVPPVLDGGPDAWFTSDGSHHGSTYYTRNATDPANAVVYRYPNTQEAAPIWFHDHTLGATRLNVYAGLAGAYVLQEAPDSPNALNPAFPPPTDIVPVVLQDRMFDTNGQLLFQAGVSGGVLWALNPEHPYWNPEFVGDTIVVNGKAWPNLDVEPRRYRFLFLNGSNARTYELFLVDRASKVVGPNMWVVATDGGYLDYPVLLDAVNLKQKLVMMPGERYEVMIDFAGLPPDTRLILKNTAKTPYPGGATPQGATVGQVMQFTVGSCLSGKCGAADTTYDPSSGTPLRSTAMVRLVDFLTGSALVQPALARQLTLNEVMGMTPWTITTDLYTGSSVTSTSPITVTYPGGPLEILLNNTKWDAGTTEKPGEGATEVWEIVNLTADAHPIHLHLVQFQILNRQAFDTAKYQAAYDLLFPGGVFQPGIGPPLPYDSGAAKAVPGVVTPASLPYVGGNPDVTPFLRSPAVPPAGQEAGWKDTALAPPGTVTRLVVRWAPTDVPAGASGADAAFAFDPSANGGGYVWHCHIIDHEDNEMMRRTSITPALAEGERTYRLGVDY